MFAQSPITRASRRQTPREAETAGREAVIGPKSPSSSARTPRGQKILGTTRIDGHIGDRVRSRQHARDIHKPNVYSEDSAKSHATHAHAVSNHRYPHSLDQKKTERKAKERGQTTSRRPGDRSHDTHSSVPTPPQRAATPFEEATTTVHRSFEPFQIRREPQVRTHVSSENTCICIASKYTLTHTLTLQAGQMNPLPYADDSCSATGYSRLQLQGTPHGRTSICLRNKLQSFAHLPHTRSRLSRAHRRDRFGYMCVLVSRRYITSMKRFVGLLQQKA